MNVKEQTPLYIVGIVAVVAIVVLVLAIGANAGGAFSFRDVSSGYTSGPQNLFDMMSRLGFSVDASGNLVGDCDNPEITQALGGAVQCDPSSQTAILPDGRTVKFGGFNYPKVQNRVCWQELTPSMRQCVRTQLNVPIPDDLNICIQTTVDPRVCEGLDCSACAAALSSVLPSVGYQAIN